MLLSCLYCSSRQSSLDKIHISWGMNNVLLLESDNCHGTHSEDSIMMFMLISLWSPGIPSQYCTWGFLKPYNAGYETHPSFTIIDLTMPGYSKFQKAVMDLNMGHKDKFLCPWENEKVFFIYFFELIYFFFIFILRCFEQFFVYNKLKHILHQYKFP